MTIKPELKNPAPENDWRRKPRHRNPKPEPSEQDDDIRILTQAEVASLLSINRATIWRLVKEGHFPPPIQLTTARKGWRKLVIRKWLADREARPVNQRTYFRNGKAMYDN